MTTRAVHSFQQAWRAAVLVGLLFQTMAVSACFSEPERTDHGAGSVDQAGIAMDLDLGAILENLGYADASISSSQGGSGSRVDAGWNKRWKAFSSHEIRVEIPVEEVGAFHKDFRAALRAEIEARGPRVTGSGGDAGPPEGSARGQQATANYRYEYEGHGWSGSVSVFGIRAADGAYWVWLLISEHRG